MTLITAKAVAPKEDDVPQLAALSTALPRSNDVGRNSATRRLLGASGEVYCAANTGLAQYASRRDRILSKLIGRRRALAAIAPYELGHDASIEAIGQANDAIIHSHANLNAPT